MVIAPLAMDSAVISLLAAARRRGLAGVGGAIHRAPALRTQTIDPQRPGLACKPASAVSGGEVSSIMFTGGKFQGTYTLVATREKASAMNVGQAIRLCRTQRTSLQAPLRTEPIAPAMLVDAGDN